MPPSSSNHPNGMGCSMYCSRSKTVDTMHHHTRFHRARAFPTHPSPLRVRSTTQSSGCGLGHSHIPHSDVFGRCAETTTAFCCSMQRTAASLPDSTQFRGLSTAALRGPRDRQGYLIQGWSRISNRIRCPARNNSSRHPTNSMI